MEESVADREWMMLVIDSGRVVLEHKLVTSGGKWIRVEIHAMSAPLC